MDHKPIFGDLEQCRFSDARQFLYYAASIRDALARSLTYCAVAAALSVTAFASDACSDLTPSFVYVRESNLHPDPDAYALSVGGHRIPKGRSSPQDVPADAMGDLGTYTDRSLRYVDWPVMSLIEPFFSQGELDCWADAGDQIALLARYERLSPDKIAELDDSEQVKLRLKRRRATEVAAEFRCPENKTLRGTKYISQFGHPIAHVLLAGRLFQSPPPPGSPERQQADFHACIASLLGNYSFESFDLLPKDCSAADAEIARHSCSR
ncbi:MAG: hypothetical protein QM698_11365 [Micropepsaceae bacterium]